MAKSLKYLADNLIISPASDRRQLPLSHPDAKVLREREIVLAALCDLREKCEVARSNPSVHILIFSLEGHSHLYTAESPRKGVPIEAGQVVILPVHQMHKYKMKGQMWKAIWFYLADTDNWRQLRNSKPHVRISVTQNELRGGNGGFFVRIIA